MDIMRYFKRQLEESQKNEADRERPCPLSDYYIKLINTISDV